jgi:hypothetical protein
MTQVSQRGWIREPPLTGLDFSPQVLFTPAPNQNRTGIQRAHRELACRDDLHKVYA